MKNSGRWSIVLCIVLLLSVNVFGQKTKKSAKKPTQKTTTQKTPPKKTETKKEPVKPTTSPAPSVSTSGATDDQKIKDIIAFLEYVLNTLGDPATSSRDKDVLINESYSKIFRDAKVQVEDDLDEDRKVITNKDVVAYLKDVDFFFENVKFELVIEDIKSNTLSNGNLFYKVSLRRTLNGTTSDGTSVTNTQPRFVEINYNPNDQDLKIVSIYTKPFDQTAALKAWWQELSYEWKSIFRKKLNLPDSITIEHIKAITAIEELDLSNNSFITTIDPLAELINLKLLDLSGSGITDLTPIRNLTELVELNIAHTKVMDLSPLKYSAKLLRLDVSNTEVSDLMSLEKAKDLQQLKLAGSPVFDFNALSNFPKLQFLDLEATHITQLLPLENATELLELNVSKTLIQNLAPLQKLQKLTTLNIDSTRVKDLRPLSTLSALKVLNANFTLVDDLQPLSNLPALERIYCDQTLIKRDKADAFHTANPKILVIYDSKDLESWWRALPVIWQSTLQKAANIAAAPTKEALARVTILDSLNIQGIKEITDITPLERLLKLRVLIATSTSIADISPLENHRELRKLDISDTQVNDLFIVRQFQKLEEFRADRTPIQNIDALLNVPGLKRVFVDGTSVHDIIAQEFLEKNPNCLLVYKTVHLDRWWKEISSNWKEIFKRQLKGDTTTTRENLHRIVEMPTVAFSDVNVSDLNVFREFIRLQSLKFSGTEITTIPALDNFRSLKTLQATNGPLQHINAVSLFKALTELDISNTPVEDLKPLAELDKLSVLNAGGTQIKKLDPLENLDALEVLDCSNTRVSSLNPVERLELKSLKCYNTKISARAVEKFKERNPNCAVTFYK